MTVEEAKSLSFFLMDKNINAWPQLSNGGACVNILVEGQCYTLKKMKIFTEKFARKENSRIFTPVITTKALQNESI